MLTLKSRSPRASLSIPSPNNNSSSNSPLASPASSAGGKSLSSGYFPPVNRPAPKRVSKDEAFKNVKAMEGLLAAWNEYRHAVALQGKAGRKMAGALRDMIGCMDKTEVAAQTMRPAAAMMDGVADLTIKLAKRIDKEYEDANADASKHFTLLAKESRSHDAYLGAIGKKHDKAEKAYRKASKTLSDTSNAHAGLQALKDTLGDDINRAHEDHQGLLGSKQAVLLLRLASSMGVVATSQFAYFSDSVRKAGTVYPDIEYFRALSDIQWHSALPPTLDEQHEDAVRAEIRLMKARVALGEMDIVGKDVWDGSKATGNVATTKPASGEGKSVESKPNAKVAFETPSEKAEKEVVPAPSVEKKPDPQSPYRKLAPSDLTKASSPPTATQHTRRPGLVSHASSDSQQSGRSGSGQATAVIAPLALVRGSAEGKDQGEKKERGDMEQTVARAISRYSDNDFRGYPDPRTPPPISTESHPNSADRPNPIPLPYSPTRMSVSQMTAAIDPSRAARESHRHSQSVSNTSSQHTLAHVQSHLPQHRHHPSISQTAAQAYKDEVYRQGERRAQGNEAAGQSGMTREKVVPRQSERRMQEESDNERDRLGQYPYERVVERPRQSNRSRRVTMPPTYSEPAFVYHRPQPPISHEDFYYASSQSSGHGTHGSHRDRPAMLDPTPVYGETLYHRLPGGYPEGERVVERRSSGVVAPRPMRPLGSSAEMEEYRDWV
ncbi:hypothetical protein B9479_001218 [Cryptococcus floricola]|uniref:IMD domain-containing protein n=1 Tax=Cryptococcus floricola TaxID=2591691 RepID=A0A5D3B569_9TREE|nr:hypothetical protein B9479_001218 [Cryptococcus floricola]